MKDHQRINQTSGNTEYYTPLEIIEAARRVMGKINLDPASSGIANIRVKAGGYFDSKFDGLKHPWEGTVWLNHPFGRIENPLWIEKLEKEYASGRMREACCITFAATSEKWFQPLLKRPQCYLVPRTDYFLPNGKKKRGVTKGSVVTYYGPNVQSFANEFESLGVVKIVKPSGPI